MSEGELIQFLVVSSIGLMINLTIGGIIAWFLGRKRVIGYGWSLFFCALNVILGFIVTMLSSKYKNANLRESKVRRVFGWIMLSLGLFMVWAVYRALTNGQNMEISGLASIGYVIALIGGGIYLLKRAKGISFHSRALDVPSSDDV